MATEDGFEAIWYSLEDKSFSFEADPYFQMLSLPGADPYFNHGSAQSILFTIMSVVVTTLCVPCMAFYIQHSNFPAFCLILWFFYLNLAGSINALVWPTDDVSTWFTGQGWCDVIVRLNGAAAYGIVGALCAIFRGLAHALDVENGRSSSTKHERITELIINGLLCIGLPVYRIAVTQLASGGRYFIFAINGCIPAWSDTWVTIVLVDIWPVIFCLVASCLAILVGVRVHRYRKQFGSIIRSSGSRITANRFTRLYILSIIQVVIVLSIQLYMFVENLGYVLQSYDWDEASSGLSSDIIPLVPMFGQVRFDHWIRVIGGIITFFAIGMGGEASEFYRRKLVFLGFDEMFPRLRKEPGASTGSRRRSSVATTIWSKTLSYTRKLKSVGGTNATSTSSGSLSPVENPSPDVEKNPSCNGRHASRPKIGSDPKRHERPSDICVKTNIVTKSQPVEEVTPSSSNVVFKTFVAASRSPVAGSGLLTAGHHLPGAYLSPSLADAIGGPQSSNDRLFKISKYGAPPVRNDNDSKDENTHGVALSMALDGTDDTSTTEGDFKEHKSFREKAMHLTIKIFKPGYRSLGIPSSAINVKTLTTQENVEKFLARKSKDDKLQAAMMKVGLY